MSDDYLTIHDISALVQVGEDTVRAWLERGLAHADKDGEVRVRRGDLDAFLAEQGQGAAHDAAEV